MRQLKRQGLAEAQILAELKRRGARTKFRLKPYGREELRAICRSEDKKRLPALKMPWRLRREELRPLVLELMAAGLTDAEMAAEFRRRGVPECTPGHPWTRNMVYCLRTAWQIPSRRRPWRRKGEHLRPILTELATTDDDARMATELNERAIPCPGSEAPWTARKVQLTRQRLGIRLGRRTSPGWLGTIHKDYEAA